MKRVRLVQSMLIGVALGFAAILVHEVVSNEELQEQLVDAVKDLHQAVEEKKAESAEDEVLKQAAKQNDPAVNQAWVEQQWEAVLN